MNNEQGTRYELLLCGLCAFFAPFAVIINYQLSIINYQLSIINEQLAMRRPERSQRE